jgi:hypothetical protein
MEFRMFYIIYKITNHITSKYYIGAHKTLDLNDGYMGSGKYLTQSQNKWGMENFSKEILHIFDNSEDMYAKEKELVTEDLILSGDVYNLKTGGSGGFDYINNNGMNGTHKGVQRRQSLINDSPEWIEYWKARRSEGVLNMDPSNRKAGIEKRKQTIAKLYGCLRTFSGKTHSEISKRKIGDKNKINQAGEKNSQYGTRWIHSLDEKVSKRIQKSDPLPDGWIEGRKIKF